MLRQIDRLNWRRDAGQDGDQTGAVTCDDGNGRVVFSKELEYTDFPPDGITLWYTTHTILLPQGS